ncbi:MAG: hypothetical protein GY830_03970 [Bacteroidetes bacterium]|nr:hypothetical protein [Bacteroidota bacterium]
MVRNISLLGGTCLFLNELNNDWQILQTNNITYVIKDAAGNEEAITLFVNLIKGNTGNY